MRHTADLSYCGRSKTAAPKADSIFHTELVVLLRVVVIKDGTWGKQLNKTVNEIYSNKLNPYHSQLDKKSVHYQSQAMINPFK